MGWGTDFTADIYLSSIMFNSKYEIEEKIESNKDDINSLFDKLKMYGSSRITDIVDPEWSSDPISWLNNEINSIRENLEELYYQNVKLGLYLTYIEEKCNGEIPKIEL